MSDVTLDTDTLVCVCVCVCVCVRACVRVCVGMHLSQMTMTQTLIPTNSYQSHLSSNVTVSNVILSFSHCDS